MTSLFRKTLAAAVLGFAALAAAVPAASAAGLGQIETVGYRNGFHGGHQAGWDRDRRPGDRGRWDRRSRCAPWLAVEKARGYGLRHARVARVTPRQVVVEGVRYQHHGRIAFANARNCPVLWR